MDFSNRMKAFETGIFAKLAMYRHEREAEGKGVVDFSIGAPNIPPAPHIMEALCEAAKDPGNYIYAISDTDELRQAVASWYKRRYNVILDTETQITSLLGSQEGLSHIALCLADEGDVVLVPEICYPVFADGPKIAGADVHYMPMKPENNFIIDFNDIPTDVAEKAKLMIISYPNNPTAVMAPDSFYDELIAFAKKYNICVVSDNAYSELTFDGRTCGSFMNFKGALDVGVEFNSLSKTYGLAGARIGFCIGNPSVVKQLSVLKSNMDYGMFLPIQKAAVAAITGDQTCVLEMRRTYQERRDYLCDGMSRVGWNMKKSEGTMFVWAKIPEKFSSSEDFCMRLIKETGVIVTPGSAFGASGEGFVRLALVRSNEEMDEAFDAIQSSGILRY